MNSSQIKAFKKLVKENGFNEISHIVEKKIGMNYGMYLSKCEPLYILSRIRGCVSDERLLSLIDVIHNQWLEIMIRNSWSTRLDSYVKRYGQQSVKEAIVKLSNEGQWGFSGSCKIDYSYEEVDEHYACFKLIDSKGEEEKVVDDSVEEQADGECNEETLSSQAQQAKERIVASLGEMQNDFAVIGQFFRMCSTQGDLANELDMERKKIEAMQLLVQRSDEEIDRLNQIVKDKSEAFEQVVSELNKKEELLIQKDERIDELRQKLHQAVESKPAIPTKKIIPESKLRELVAVGDKMIRQLTPFLAQYDIIVNPHK